MYTQRSETNAINHQCVGSLIVAEKNKAVSQVYGADGEYFTFGQYHEITKLLKCANMLRASRKRSVKNMPLFFLESPHVLERT